MSLMVQDYHECRQTLRYLQQSLPVERVFLACAYSGTSWLRALIVRDGAVEKPVVLPRNGIEAAFRHVIWTNRPIKASSPAIAPHPKTTPQNHSDQRRAPCEGRPALLAMPVCGPDGAPVACLSIASPLTRIWSRREEEELCYVAAMLRSILYDATDHNWHSAIMRDCDD